MDKKIPIAVVGGDRRQEQLAELFRADGHETYMINRAADLGAIAAAELTVLPLPACRDDGTVGEGIPVTEIFLRMRHGSIGAGGRIPDTLFGMAELRGVSLWDYTKREDFAVANAVATAEGAIGIAVAETDITIQGARCLIIGNGRIGKILSDKLHALGAGVTVSARRAADIAWIKARGHQALQTAALAPSLGEFDVIINTVPAPVLAKAELAQVGKNALIVDLASVPGGVDFEAAKTLGKRVIWALSLPAKVAPYSAASYVRDSLYNIMEESNGS